MANSPKPDHSNAVRLAENEYAAVDMCHCGALQLHLGDLSMRLPAELVLALTRTLSAALARRQSILNERAAENLVGSSWTGNDTPRGKA
jgi:hypothetical protein